MKMNEVIRKYRKERGLTQEQVAGYLGVSTPAVNKWESGSSYPDITLIPALARLLRVDLNTLMCFQENLSEHHHTDLQTIGIKKFNDLVAADKRVEKVILPLRDGLTIIRKC